MRNIKGYYRHLNKKNRSLLQRIYGVYQIQMQNMEPINFIVTGNIYQNQIPKYIFELKGSEGRCINGCFCGQKLIDMKK